MNYVKSFDFFGVPAAQIPSITGSGAPTTATEGAVGCLYMDTATGNLYKCTAATNGVYTWVEAGNGSSQNANGLTTAQINALDGMFKVCAFTKADVSAEYTAFKTAFGITDSGGDSGGGDSGETETTLTGISATYSGGDVTVGTDVADLTGIVVTAHYSDGSTTTVTGYTLSGTIAEGENTITVTYGGKTTTFTVTGVAESGGDSTPYTPELVWEDGYRIATSDGSIYEATDYSVCQLIDISDYTSLRVTTTSTNWFNANVYAGTTEQPKTVLKTNTSYWGGSYMTDETFDISEYSYLRIESKTDKADTFTIELS